MTMHWWALLGAGVLEIAWAAGFKFAFRDNHTITSLTLAAMGGSFWLLSIAMRTIPVGTAYAIWTGIGAAGAALVGIVFLKEPATALRILSVAAIIGGVVGLKLSAGSAA